MGTETGDKGEQTLRGLKDTADTELRMSALVCMLASAWLDCATSSIGCCYEPQPLPKIHRYCAVFESPRQCLAGLGDHSLEGLPSLLPHMLAVAVAAVLVLAVAVPQGHAAKMRMRRARQRDRPGFRSVGFWWEQPIMWYCSTAIPPSSGISPSTSFQTLLPALRHCACGRNTAKL